MDNESDVVWPKPKRVYSIASLTNSIQRSASSLTILGDRWWLNCAKVLDPLSLSQHSNSCHSDKLSNSQSDKVSVSQHNSSTRSILLRGDDNCDTALNANTQQKCYNDTREEVDSHDLDTRTTLKVSMDGSLPAVADTTTAPSLNRAA